MMLFSMAYTTGTILPSFCGWVQYFCPETDENHGEAEENVFSSRRTVNYFCLFVYDAQGISGCLVPVKLTGVHVKKTVFEQAVDGFRPLRHLAGPLWY
jgi:hypothetical protein